MKKKPKIEKNNENPKKNAFLIYFHRFSIFNIISREFKFSKVFWTRSTFNALILQSLIFLVESTLILFFFKIQKKRVEVPMCFGDQTTLPINRGSTWFVFVMIFFKIVFVDFIFLILSWLRITITIKLNHVGKTL